MPRGDEHKARAKTYLLNHPGASNAQVCTSCHVSIRTVTNARAELLSENLIPPAYGDNKSKKVNAAETIEAASSDVFDVKTTSDLNKAVAEEMAKEAIRHAAADAAADAELTATGEIDVAKLKKVLWRVVHRNTDDRIVVAAASALARIQQEANARPLGPGKPMTRSEAKSRLLMLLKACGIDLVVETINEWTGRSSNAQASQPDLTPQAPPETTGASNNDPQPGVGP